MKTHHISVEKTARFYTLGELNENTEQLIFLLHGYGQTAFSMLRSCRDLASEKTFLVAPEGLSRFYWEQFSGNVVASWMTSDDRESEIKDYTNYLNKLYDQFKSSSPKVSMLCLGFSQGVATGSRWVSGNERNFSKMISIAGSPAKEIDWTDPTDPINRIPHLYLVGDNDRWIDLKFVNEYRSKLESAGINFKLEIFEGDHNITPEAIQSIQDFL